MQDLNDKITGNTLTAVEWNEVPSEIQNVIEGLGQTLTSGDLNQLGKAIAGYVSNGNFYTESGIADAYVLSVVGLKQRAPTYTNGFKITFIAGNTNTGASTVNVAGLGVKNIKLSGGGNPLAGSISGRVALIFDGPNDRFELLNARIDRLNPDTLAIWQDDTSAVVRDVVTTKERSTGNAGGATGDVISGTGTANGFDIVAHNTLSLSWVLRTSLVNDARAFGAIEGQDATGAINAAITRLGKYSVLDLGGSYLGEAIAVNQINLTIRNGKITAPLDATTSIFLVTVDNIEFQNVDTFVDWINLTGAAGTVNVGGLFAKDCNKTKIVGGEWIGGRSDDYPNYPIELGGPPIAFLRCNDGDIQLKRLADFGFTDGLILTECLNFNIWGGIFDNGKFSGITTQTSTARQLVITTGQHTLTANKLSNMGTSTISINDPFCEVISPIIRDGLLHGVTFGHVTTAPADNCKLIGGSICNVLGQGVSIGESKSVSIMGATIDNTGLSSVKFFDDCAGGYVGGRTRCSNAGDDFISFSIDAFPGLYTVDDVILDTCENHGIQAIGGTEYIIRNVEIKDVDNANANKNVFQWNAAPIAPIKLTVSGLEYKHVSSASPANRGINVDSSTGGLVVEIHDNDLKDVDFEKIRFGGVVPTTVFAYKNRFSTDPMVGFVAFAGGSTTQLVSNGNLSQFSMPKITYRDVDCHTRQIFVTSPTDGSFMINGTVGANADFTFEV